MDETATPGWRRPNLRTISLGTALASAHVHVTMLRLTDAQRAVLTQALPAVAHVAVGALVFGQFLREQPYSLPLALIGIGIWFWFVGVAVALAGGKQ